MQAKSNVSEGGGGAQKERRVEGVIQREGRGKVEEREKEGHIHDSMFLPGWGKIFFWNSVTFGRRPTFPFDTRGRFRNSVHVTLDSDEPQASVGEISTNHRPPWGIPNNHSPRWDLKKFRALLLK